jgi:predicted RNA binding protein YcfA (HicA-like mRNA interferase family)
MKVKEIIKEIEADGWREAATSGSHRQFKHPTKPGRVTVAGSSLTTCIRKRSRRYANKRDFESCRREENLECPAISR